MSFVSNIVRIRSEARPTCIEYMIAKTTLAFLAGTFRLPLTVSLSRIE
jgi:hypothetical protein